MNETRYFQRGYVWVEEAVSEARHGQIWHNSNADASSYVSDKSKAKQMAYPDDIEIKPPKSITKLPTYDKEWVGHIRMWTWMFPGNKTCGSSMNGRTHKTAALTAPYPM